MCQLLVTLILVCSPPTPTPPPTHTAQPFAFDRLPRCDNDKMVAPPWSLVLEKR